MNSEEIKKQIALLQQQLAQLEPTPKPSARITRQFLKEELSNVSLNVRTIILENANMSLNWYNHQEVANSQTGG